MRYRLVLALEELSTLEFYSASLESAGFEVITCAPGDAIHMAAQKRPDVVVIDGSRVPGVSACGQFKSHPALKRVPLVALMPPDAALPPDRQCDAVLSIDCLPGALVDALDRLLLAHHGD